MTWLFQDQNDAVSFAFSAIWRSRHFWAAKNVGAKSVDAREALNPEQKPSQVAHFEEPKQRPETWSRWYKLFVALFCLGLDQWLWFFRKELNEIGFFR